MTDALEHRLRMIIPYLSKWPEAMAIMALPTQVTVHTRNVLDLVDSIWHFYGDTSTDVSRIDHFKIMNYFVTTFIKKKCLMVNN